MNAQMGELGFRLAQGRGWNSKLWESRVAASVSRTPPFRMGHGYKAVPARLSEPLQSQPQPAKSFSLPLTQPCKLRSEPVPCVLSRAEERQALTL